MPVIPFEKLGAIGLITDVPAHELPPEAWSSALNVRFSRGKVERFGGHAPVFGTPSVSPYWLMAWDDAQELYTFYASASKVYRTDGVNHTDVTNTGGDYSAGTYPRWNGGVLGGVPIINNTAGTDPPQMWDSGTSKFEDLDNWPASTFCKVIRPYKQFLIALDITASGTRYPTKLLWSHPADPGTVPSSWDVADNTVEAGEASISETTGFLVDCLPLADVNVIYKEDSTWYMRHTGTGFIFQFGMLFRDRGMMSPNCVAEFSRKHFVVGFDDIWVHDGQSAQSIIEGRVRDYIFSSIDPTFYKHSFVATNPKWTEVWFFWPSTGEVWPNMVAVWNWTTGVWTLRELGANIAFASHQTVDTSGVDDTFEGSSGTTFASDSGSFGDRSFNPATSMMVLAEPGDNKAFLTVDSSLTWDGQSVDSYVERTGLAVSGQNRQGEPIIDVGSVKFVRRIYPDVRGDDGLLLKISIGAQNRIGETVRWYGPWDYDPARDFKLDCTVSGRLISVRFETSQDLWWELAGYKLDLDVVGVH